LTKAGYKMTEIGKIPEEWTCHTIGDTEISVNTKAGGTPLRSKKEYYENGNIPFVKIADIVNSGKYLDNTTEKINERGIKNSSSWITPPYSILFSMYASYGELTINKVPVATNQAILSIIPNKSNIDLEYFYYQLKFLKPRLVKYLRYTTQNNLNASVVNSLIIPVAPLPEQQKIAEILSTADDEIQKVNEQITLTEQLKKGLMQRLLTRGIGHTKFKMTEIGEIPEEWGVKELKEFAKVEYGKSNPRTNGKIPLVGSSGIFGKVAKALIESPTIVIGRKGTAGAVWDIEGPSWPSDTSFYLIYKNYDIVQKYLYSFMSLNKLSGDKAKTTLPSLQKTELEKFIVPLPPLPEQQKIAGILSTVDNKLELLRTKRDKLDVLKKGLMNDLLTGKVRVKV